MTRNKHTKTPGASWKDFFSFSRRLRRGLTVLSCVIGLEIAFLIYLKYLPLPPPEMDAGAIVKEIDALYARPLDSAKRHHARPAADNTGSERRSGPVRSLFYFNPNQLPDSQWAKLGFSARQIQSIKNYESKGGHFRSKADVKKMYAIRDAEYERIAPYIVIPDKKPDTVHPNRKSETAKPPMDIGTADTTELDKLPLIGPALARRISIFRDRLGGFYSIDQLREVYGISDSAFLVIRPRVQLKDSTNLRKINLNEAGFQDLVRHPYIDSRLANLILAYRKQHGPFASPGDLRKIALVDDELYRKIAPYLKTE